MVHGNSAITSTDRDSNESGLEEVGTIRVHFFLFQRHIVAFRTLGNLYLAMKVPNKGSPPQADGVLEECKLVICV
jgi:hypothetical protein